MIARNFKTRYEMDYTDDSNFTIGIVVFSLSHFHLYGFSNTMGHLGELNFILYLFYFGLVPGFHILFLN